MVVGCTFYVKAIQQNKTSQVMLQGQAAPNSKWLKNSKWFKTAKDYFSLMLPVHGVSAGSLAGRAHTIWLSGDQARPAE